MRSFCLVISILLTTIAFAQQKRVALIIGNEEYGGHFSKLHTPRNDANAMYNVLRKLGFEEPIIAHNVRRDSMSYYVEKFAKLANGAELALFYYSGHAGIGKNDEYYLAPSGSYRSAETLVEDCYSFQVIENRIKKISVPTKIYIIDACRNSIDGSKDMVRYSPQSLSKNFSNTKGTIYCFATGVNKTAETGKGDYSIFTESLLNHIGDMGSLYSVWKKISDEVTRANAEQTPLLQETTNGLSKNVYLNPNNIRLYNSIKQGLDSYTFITDPLESVITVGDKSYNSNHKIMLKYGQKYEVSISAPGYATYKETITPTPYKTTYKISLDKLAKANLRIQCDNKGAIAFFDEERKGYLPVNIDTYAGIHNIRIECAGYESYHSRPVLKAGAQTHYVRLKKHYPWFIDWDDSDAPQNYLSYQYSPKYQIGLLYMYRFEDTHFLLGANMALSTGLFRGLKTVDVTVSTSSYTNTMTTTTDEYGNTVAYNTLTTTTSGITDEYSDEIDPYHEAKTYDSHFMFLAAGGYMPCNGILLETGLGAAAHCEKTYMPCNYTITKSVTTNLSTGEVVGEPQYEYTRKDGSHWYIGKYKWSPVMRVGMKLNIPVSTDNFLTVGGGYTYLFSNNKYSSWDVSIGFAWAL